MRKILVALSLAVSATAFPDWHYRPYEYEAWMLQRMRVENARGILHVGYPGPHLTLSAEPEAFYAEGDVEGYETVRGAPGVPPHRVLRPERLLPVEAKDGYYDLGHEDIGYVRVMSRQQPSLFVGESLAEMRNSDTNGFEQSTRMVRESCDGWRSDIPLALRYFRFDGPVSNVAFCAQSEPIVPQGAFVSGDARTDRAWLVGAETLRLCTRTFFLDAVKRDRLPWAGDLVLALLSQAYAFGDPEPARRSLAVLGATDPARGHVNGIGGNSLWWVIAHDVFQLHFGDAAFLKLHYPRIRARLEELESHVGPTGFLDHGLGWNFMDWTDRKSGILRSAITLQGIYYGALQAGVRLARRMGDVESEAKWTRRAERLKVAVLAKGMDGTRHARMMAIVYGLVEGEEARRLAKEIAADNLPPTITPYMSAFEVMALVKGGETAAARRKYESVWGEMVDAGVGTFWEGWDHADKGDQVYEYYGRPFGKSLCHAWSSGPTFLFPMCFMGVVPTEDGWRSFKVDPGFAAFAPNARVRVKTANGPVEVKFEAGAFRVVEGRARCVNTPATMSAVVELKNDWLAVAFDGKTGAFEIADRVSGRTWRSVVRPGRETFAVRDVKRDETGTLAFRLVVTNAPARVYDCRLTLDGGEVEVKIDAPKDQPMAGIRLGYPYPFESEAGDRFYFPNGCGLSLPCELKDPSGVGDASINRAITDFQRGYHTSMKMGCWIQYAEKPLADGSLEQGAGVLAIVKTPWDVCLTFPEGPDGRRIAGVDWIASRGVFGETRCVRFAFFDRATPGALARRYREEMDRRGYRVTFGEKARRNPKLAEKLDLLQGAPDVWYWTEKTDKAAVARELRAMGFDNFLFSTITRHDLGIWVTPEEVRELARIPRMLLSEYDIYCDTMEPEMLDKIDMVRPHWPIGAWAANDCVMQSDGKLLRGWKVPLKSDPTKPAVGCLRLCEKQAPKYIRERVAKRLAEAPFDTRFLDVTGTHVGECWNPAHPLTRHESMAARQEMFRTVRDEFSLVTGTEDGLECYAPVVDYFEGVFNASYWRVDGGRYMWKVYEETPEVVKRGLDPAIRFPFWEMVFRDCVVGYWYWTCYNNKFPADWWKLDLLNVVAGTPPMYLFTPETYAKQKDRLAASYKVATSTARAAKGATLDEFRWLTSDRLVQQSEFSNGLVVTVNFSERPYVTKDGRVVLPHGYLQGRR